jgi:hypothetical protein
MRFGDALVLRESVVTRKSRIALGSIPALCISFATVLRQHGTAWVRLNPFQYRLEIEISNS